MGLQNYNVSFYVNALMYLWFVDCGLIEVLLLLLLLLLL
jgi:hypothetical protein